MNAIIVEDLHKRYRDNEAVREVSFAVASGEIFALLGPNGAGKTTVLEILEGFRARDEGRVSVLGRDPGVRSEAARLREDVGLVLQDIAVEAYLTVRETIARSAGYYSHPRAVGEVIELAGLAGKERAKVKDLSGGQKRRLDLALGVIGDPVVLFLDEPTTGFDPGARHDAWEVVRNLRAAGTTILLTTHYMDEAQALADRVAVIAAGRIVDSGPPATIGGRDVARRRIRFVLPAGLGADDIPLPVTPAADLHHLDDGRVTVETDEPTRALHDLTGWALGRGFTLERLVVEQPSLEDVYLHLTGPRAEPEASLLASAHRSRS